MNVYSQANAVGGPKALSKYKEGIGVLEAPEYQNMNIHI